MTIHAYRNFQRRCNFCMALPDALQRDLWVITNCGYPWSSQILFHKIYMASGGRVRRVTPKSYWASRVTATARMLLENETTYRAFMRATK